MNSPLPFTLYTRRQCPLCDVFELTLKSILKKNFNQFIKVITLDSLDSTHIYSNDVPVLCHDDIPVKMHRISSTEVKEIFNSFIATDDLL